MDELQKLKTMSWFVDSVTINSDTYLDSGIMKMKIRMGDMFKPLFGKRLFGIREVLTKLNLLNLDLNTMISDEDSFTVFNKEQSRKIKIKLGEDDMNILSDISMENYNDIKPSIEYTKNIKNYIELKLHSTFLKELANSIKVFGVNSAVFIIKNSELIIKVQNNGGDSIVLLREDIEDVDGVSYEENIIPMFDIDWTVRIYTDRDDKGLVHQTSLWLNDEHGFEVLNPLYKDDLNSL